LGVVPRVEVDAAVAVLAMAVLLPEAWVCRAGRSSRRGDAASGLLPDRQSRYVGAELPAKQVCA
jgi:hypothetical protein